MFKRIFEFLMKEKITRILGRSEIIVTFLFLLFFVFFSNICTDFFSIDMFSIILLLGAELGIIAIGEALLMISGEIDLSVASVYVFSIFITLELMNVVGLPFLLSALIAVAFGCLIGLLNGFITLRFKIPSFVVTLGGLLFWRSIISGITNGEPIYYKGGPSLFMGLLGEKIGFIPILFFWFLGFGIIFSILLTRTKFGNWVFATGGDRDTARALGVNTDRVKLTCFMISSGLAAFAGVAYLGYANYLDPIIATGVEMEAIASAVLGGVLLTGGVGSIFSTAICALLLKEIQVGTMTYGIVVEYYRVFVGVLLVIGVIINRQVILIQIRKAIKA